MKKFYFLILIALGSHSLFAQTIRYVTPTGTGTGTGSWANASGDLQAMIDELASLDATTFPDRQIWVAAGTYKPVRRADATGTVTLNDRFNAFVMKAGVQIYGGLAVGQISLSGRNFVDNASVLSGNIGDENIDTDNAYHVVVAAGDMTGGILDGFTITKGYASGTGTSNIISVNGRDVPDSRAAGIIVYYADNAKFNNLKIENNYNSSNQNSGAIYLFYSASVLFNDVEFKDNECFDGNGGAVFSFGSLSSDPKLPASATFTDCSFVGNKSGGAGGAVYASTGSELTFINSKFMSNTSTGNGGAIFSTGTTTAGNRNSIRITNTIFYDNTSKGSNGGGAIYNSSGSELTVTNISLFGNTSENGYGTVFIFSSASSVLKMYNSIFNGNTTSTGTYLDFYKGGAAPSFVIRNTLAPSNTYITDGVNGNIVNPSPITLFESTDPHSPDFLKLKTGSIALDAGDNSLSTALVDLASLPRIRNTTIDLGAYEFQIGNYPLPIKLEAYTAVKKGSTSVLSWKTVSEQNNQKFVIERGASANDFVFFKEVAGAGDSSTPLSYSVTDFAPLSGANYYRLTQYDNDGTPTILGVEAVSFDLSPAKAQVYPNPAKNYIEVKPSSSNGIVSLNLISLTGKTILTNNYAQAAVHENVKLDLANVPTGTYILWINKGRSNSEKQTLLVVK